MTVKLGYIRDATGITFKLSSLRNYVMITQREGAPKASLLWLNYNSSRIMDVVLKSLESLFNIDYPNYEVIIIDNASNDGSIQVIEDFIRKVNLERDLPPIKVVKNDRNLGYTGGNYIGYKHRAKDSKYVVLVNNDLIIEPLSLMPLIRYLEEHRDVGAVQGKITTWDGSRIGNCGFYFDSIYRVYPRYEGLPVTKGDKEATISNVSGCYSVFRVEAAEKCGGLFGSILGFFGYFDDADMCLRLWRNGYKVKYVPVLAGRHKGGASFFEFQPLTNYLNIRNRLSSILNVAEVRRFTFILWVMYILSRVLMYLGLGVLYNEPYRTRAKNVTRALVDGFSLARKIRKIEGDALEPYIRLRISTFVKMTFLPSLIVPIISSMVNDKETYKIKV